MKKLIAMLLALTFVFGLAACGSEVKTPETEAVETQPVETTPAETEPAETEPAETEGTGTETAGGALDVLSSVWAAVAEDSKFFAMGGDYENPVDGAPGAYNLADEGLTATFLVPADQLTNIDEAATLMHAMMANNFTFGAYHVTGDVNAFVEAMHTAITGNRWMCGMPEKLMIVVVDGEYVIAGYGINDAVAPFETALTATYPNAEVKYNEAITG